MGSKKYQALLYATLAAVFYAINIPASKLLLHEVGPTTMAALLYLGAGIGVGILALVNRKEAAQATSLSKQDLPYVIGMIVLDIVAPILLMLGISYGTSANASLLGSFEIVATAIIALLIFKESVSKRLWGAIALISLSSVLLSFEGADSFKFSLGSLFVLLATTCWGLENNCTRSIASKSTYQIVVLKGIFSGLGALVIALIKGESMPELSYVLAAMLLGFVAYGSVIVMADTLILSHTHSHEHTIVHTHDGTTHAHTVSHSHRHNHYLNEDKHAHHHDVAKLEKLPGARHV